MVQLILAILIPILIIKYRNNKIINSVGVIGISYLGGFLYAIIIWLLTEGNIISPPSSSIIEVVSYFAVALSIPLLLFSNDIKLVLKLSKKVLFAFLIFLISVLFVITGLYLVFTKNIPEGNILSGMALALYTGGTPNLNAVAYVFGINNDLILSANMSDIIFGGIFYAFLIFYSKPFVDKFLKRNKKRVDLINEDIYSEHLKSNKINFKNKKMYKNIGLSLLIIILSIIVGYFIWNAKGKIDGTLTNYLVPALMIGATIGGIIFSFFDSVRKVEENYILGQYFACIFSFTIASMISFSNIGIISFKIFIMFSLITLLSFLIYMVFCKIFNINSDIMITTATAGIYGPAFIPSVTHSIKADYMLPTGLILGALGYSIATFIGIGYIKLLSLLI